MLTKQIDFASNAMSVKLNKLVKKNPVVVSRKDDGLKRRSEVTLRLRENINLYLEELENITSRKMSSYQKESIKSYIYTNEIYKIDNTEHNKKRREFHQSCRNLRIEWERETEHDWPKYQKDVYVNGKLWRMRGENYDAHHIIELSFGGPNVWYNIIPAASPVEHPYAIHASGSMCTKIFGDIKSLEEKKVGILLLGVDEEDELQAKDESQKKSKVTKISENVIRIH